MKIPNPKEIVEARHNAGLSQTSAAALIYKKLRAWQGWEGGEALMDPAYWELWCIKVKSIRKATTA